VKVLVDTGPLVALLNERDPFHKWVLTKSRQLRGGWLTCEPVLSEAIHLLETHHAGVQKLAAMLDRGAIKIGFAIDDQLPAVLKLLRRYSDLPMSLADACLVRMSELDESARVFTLDTDFRIYRRSNRQVIPLIFPDPR
jgi:predicted nucleic acid-binding protein